MCHQRLLRHMCHQRLLRHMQLLRLWQHRRLQRPLKQQRRLHGSRSRRVQLGAQAVVPQHQRLLRLIRLLTQERLFI
jgi:hypothetical protein